MRFLSLVVLLAATWIAAPERLPGQVSSEDAFTVATGHYQRGRWLQAVDLYEEVLRKSPQDSRKAAALLYAGEALMQVKEYAAARRRFQQLLEMHEAGEKSAEPYAARALFRAGQSAFFVDAPHDAQPLLARFAAQHPDDPLNAYALSYLGQLALDRDAWTEAREHLALSLSRFPQGPLSRQCRFGMGQCMQHSGQLDEAERFYLHVLEGEQTALTHDARLRLGKLYFEQQRLAEAANTLQPTSECEWRDLAPLAGYWRGHSLRGLRQWPEAAACLQQTGRRFPDHPLASEMAYFSAASYSAMGQDQEATDLLTELIERWPSSRWRAEAMADLIELRLAGGDDPQVESLMIVFLEQWPAHARAWRIRRERAQKLLLQQDAPEAIEVLEVAVKNFDDPQPASSWYLLALAYQASGRPADAVAAATNGLQAAEADELRHALFFVKAGALSRIGDHAASAQVYQDLQQQPLDPSTRSQSQAAMLVELAHSGQWTTALSNIAEYNRETPPDARVAAAIRFAADAAYQQQRFGVSAQLYRRLAECSSEPMDAIVAGLAWSTHKLGRAEEARLALQQLLQDFPDSPFAREAQPLLAGLLDETQQRGPAIDAYLRLARDSASPAQASQALRRAAELLLLEDRAEPALELLERLEAEFPAYDQLDEIYYQRAWIQQTLGHALQRQAVLEQLIQRFPQSKFAADATWRLAEQAALEGRTRDALSWTERLLANDLASQELRGYAQMLSGRLLARRGDWELAQAHWRTLREQLPEHPLQAAANFWLAESEFQLRRYDQAAQRFAELAAASSDGGRYDHPAARVAPLRQAQALAHLDRWQEALDLLSPILEQTPPIAMAHEAWYVNGRCFAALGRFEDARTSYQRAIGSAGRQSSETAAKAQWMIGETWMHQRRYREAIVAYHLVELRHPHPHWQALALLQAGKCHEQLRDPDAGRQLFEQILREFPETPAAVTARARLANESATPLRQARMHKEQP